MRNKSWLRIEKNVIKCEKAWYYGYMKQFYS